MTSEGWGEWQQGAGFIRRNGPGRGKSKMEAEAQFINGMWSVAIHKGGILYLVSALNQSRDRAWDACMAALRVLQPPRRTT
jgi:hypothetical protein